VTRSVVISSTFSSVLVDGARGVPGHYVAASQGFPDIMSIIGSMSTALAVAPAPCRDHRYGANGDILCRDSHHNDDQRPWERRDGATSSWGQL